MLDDVAPPFLRARLKINYSERYLADNVEDAKRL